MGAEAVVWLVLGMTTIVAGVRARTSQRALRVGRLALGALFVLGGALVNALYLGTGTDYSGFADESYLAIVRDTWGSVVAPNQGLWIGMLIVFEAIAGGLVWSGGRRATVGMLAIMVFHVLLLPFGWFFYLWSLPMLFGVGLLLRAHRRDGRVPTTTTVGTVHAEQAEPLAPVG